MKFSRIHPLLLVVLVILLQSCSQSDHGRYAKIALAAYDTKYSQEDLSYLAQNSDLLIMHESLAGAISHLRQVNPDIKLFLYKFSGLTNDSSIGHSAAGFDFVHNSHKEWFLLDRSGIMLTDQYSDFSRIHSFFMDPGSQGWRQFSVESYLASSSGWDGVFLDVVELEINQISDNGMLEYKGDMDYQSALKAYLYYAHSLFSSANKIFLINGASLINQDPYYVDGEGYWQEFLNLTDGGLEEAFANKYSFSGRPVWQPKERWLNQLDALDYAGKNKKVYIAFSHNRNLNKNDSFYSYCSYLLAANEYSYFYDIAVPKYRIASIRASIDFDYSMYALDLGRPLGSRYEHDSLWLRKYESGLVVVNPDDSIASLKTNAPSRDFESGVISDSFVFNPKSARILLFGS
jgi:hypothetical protein